jgi:hypothetical protein
MAKKKAPPKAEKTEKPEKKTGKKRPKRSRGELLLGKLNKMKDTTDKIHTRMSSWPDDPSHSVSTLVASLAEISEDIAAALEAAADLPDGWPPKNAQIEINFPVVLKPNKYEKYAEMFDKPAEAAFIVVNIHERQVLVRDVKSGAKHRIPRGDLLVSGNTAASDAEDEDD